MRILRTTNTIFGLVAGSRTCINGELRKIEGLRSVILETLRETINLFRSKPQFSGNAKRGLALCLSLLALLSNPNVTYADMFRYGQFGIGFDHPGMETYSDVKYVEFGGQGQHGKLAYKAGIGGWVDSTGYSKKYDGSTYHVKSSGYGTMMFGVMPKASNFYMKYMVGPAVVLVPDAFLGHPLQIHQEFGFGMRDSTETRVGFVVKHFSNGGVFNDRNMGRNFYGIEIQF